MARYGTTRRRSDPPPPADDNSNELLPSDSEESEEEDKAEAVEPVLEANIRESTIAMFRRVLSFSQEAATALYDDQRIMTFDTLCELDDESLAARSPELGCIFLFSGIYFLGPKKCS